MANKRRIVITGRPGVGKTTLIERVIAKLSIPVGGMITKEIRKCDHRVGFSVIDIATGNEGILAHIHQTSGPKMGRYRVNLRDLEKIGIAAIDSALSDGTLVVIDEIGPMEITSAKFIPAVERVVESDVPFIISTHAKLDHPLIHHLRQAFTLYRVKLGNRDELIELIRQEFA
ncbi:MAG: NTPase [Candidatus Bipolaricaulota bacterium]|nr:NTPase [Candidatus Bipolaricaulota bacterium]